MKDVTPQEAWSGIKPSVKHFRVWGSLAHAHIPDEKRGKLVDKSLTCVMFGFSDESKGYMLYNPTTKKITVSKDVVLEETKGWNWEEDQDNSEVELTWNDDDHIWEESDSEGEEGREQANEEEQPAEFTEAAKQPGRTREGRVVRPPRYLNDYITGNESDEDEDVVNMVEVNSSDPVSFEEAEKSLKWREAMNEKIRAIERNETWELTELPRGAKCIGVKWIYKTKLNEVGEASKYKARIVAKGYSQEHGIDYTEIYAPVARMDTIRTIIATAARKAWDIYQLDVKSAFLHGILEEVVYIQQLKGYVIRGEEDKVYRLHKALYGLKQAPRAWFSRIKEYFAKEGFEKSENEETFFTKTNKHGNSLYVSVYVDDLIYTGGDMEMIEEFKHSMKKEFDMTDLSKMRYFLGIEVLETSFGIHISQA